METIQVVLDSERLRAGELEARDREGYRRYPDTAAVAAASAF